MHRALTKSHPFSLVLCDIDHFKKVNDTYGHLIGDAVLRSFARIVKDTVIFWRSCFLWHYLRFLR